MPAATSEQAPTPLTIEEQRRIAARLIVDLAKARRRLLPEYEQECNDCMLDELPRGRRRHASHA